MLDGVLFLVESGLFFAMSRALAIEHWKDFYSTVSLLLVVDSIWAATALIHNVSVWRWLVLNLSFAPLVGLLLWRFWNDPKSEEAVKLGTFLILFRTIVDYAWQWPFYFPPFK
jgi:hypothetical protein